MSSEIAEVNVQLNKNAVMDLDGITIDTAANSRSVMGKIEYTAYKDFRLKVPIIQTKHNSLNVFGWMGKVFGESKIQMQLKALGIIINVDYSIYDGNPPSLLFIRDMI